MDDLSKSLFSHSRKLYSKFPHKIFVIILRDMIGLEQYIFVFQPIINQNCNV